MDDAIIFSWLNDFIFCPVSIYFHNLYGNQTTMTYQTEKQINGTAAHKSIYEAQAGGRISGIPNVGERIW
jgi:CRISPR-associated protein Cas4